MNPYSDSMNNRRFQHNPAWWLLLLKNQLINETEKSPTHFTIRTYLCSILLLEFLLFQEQLGSGLGQNVGSTALIFFIAPADRHLYHQCTEPIYKLCFCNMIYCYSSKSMIRKQIGKIDWGRRDYTSNLIYWLIIQVKQLKSCFPKSASSYCSVNASDL